MRNSKKTAKAILVGVLTLAMGASTLFSGVGESYAASDLKLNKTSRNILTRRSYDFDVVGASDDAVITWKSSNEKIATVDQDGVVTGITKGEAKITCTVKDGGKTVKLTATAKIRKPAVKIVIKNKSKVKELEVGKEFDLNRTLTPSTSNDVTTWKSSNKKIATVDKMGVVTAKKNGTVTITATTMSGKTDSVEIKVVGGKATATPKPQATKAPDAPKATEAPKATQAPKATATPKPQAPAKAETKTVTFAEMTQPMDKGGVWNCTADVDGKGKLTLNCSSAYAQSFWQFPVDMKNVEKVTFNGVTGTGAEFRMMTADEYTAYDGSQTATFQSSDTSYATNGTALAYLNVTSTDGNPVSVESITFTMKAGGAAKEEKPAAAASKYTFAKMTQPEDKGKNWSCQTEVDGAGKLTMTSDAGSVWTQSFWKLPDGVDMSKVKKMTFNGVTGAGVEFRIMTEAQYTAYDGNANQEATFQSSETSYATNGAAIAYFIVVSKDGSPITIDSISFE